MGHLDMLGTVTAKSIIKDKDVKTILIIGASLKSSMLNYFIEENKYEISVIDNSTWAIEQSKIQEKSITSICKDAITHNDYNYDLVISFIMEHIEYSDAITLWDKITSQAKYAIFIVPEGEHEQEPFDENFGFKQITEYWDASMILSDFNNVDTIENKKYHLIVEYSKK